MPTMRNLSDDSFAYSLVTATAPPMPVGTAERSRRYRATALGQATKTVQRERDYFSRPFVGWDGEGVTTADGIHRYVLLANSHDDYIVNEQGIPSQQALDFLLETSARVKGIHVAFGAGYDINMILSDWNRDQLLALYKNRTYRRGAYTLSWRPGKSLYVRCGKHSVTLFDCLPFFQCSFDKACAQYLGEDYPDREMIQANKRLRSEFVLSDLDTIVEYNRAELRNLVTLMNELRSRLNKVGLRPSRWDGPGAVAAALFKREGVKHGLAPNRTEDSPESRASRFAYAGGRFEVIRWGDVERSAYEYDLNSAYPSALRNVPCLAHGRWLYLSGNHLRDEREFAVYHVRYAEGRNGIADLPAPLFRRETNGAICYPPNVTGWYWSPEAHAAHEYVERFGGSIEVLEAYVWQAEPCDNPFPFSFIPPMFEKRRELKKAGDGAHVGIKLGLNSLYGKTAQQVGWQPARNGKPVKIPPYHQLEWAGYTTAHCRAQVLRAAMQNLPAVIAFETDALFTSEPLELTFGSGLGEWEVTEFTRLAYIQSGMYFAETTDGTIIERTRGVDRDTIHRSDVLNAMAHPLAIERKIRAPLTRFIGAGLALSQDFDKWRTWDRSVKEIWACPAPGGKRAHDCCRHCWYSQPKKVSRGQVGARIGVWHETYVPWMTAAHSAEYPIAWLNPNDEMTMLEEMRLANYENGDSL